MLLVVYVGRKRRSSGAGLVDLVLERGGARTEVVKVGERSVVGSWRRRYVVVAWRSVSVSERDVCAD